MEVAKAFGFTGFRIVSNEDIEQSIQKTLKTAPPSFHEVLLDETQFFEPKLLSRKLPDGTMVSPRLDDMAPFLSSEELQENRLD